MTTNGDSKMQDRMAQLETELINGYLARFGHDPEAVRRSQDPEMHVLLREASLFASGQLAAVECRSRYVEDMHHGSAGNMRRPHR
jgi:hypothetical protein